MPSEIGLGDLVRQLSEVTYAELSKLMSKGLVNHPEDIRAVKLLEFVGVAKKRMAHILAISQWLGRHNGKGFLANVSKMKGKLDMRGNDIDRGLMALHQLHASLYGRRITGVNVPMACDIAALGTYPYLPVGVFTAGQAPEPPSVDLEVLKTELDTAIRARLFTCAEDSTVLVQGVEVTGGVLVLSRRGYFKLVLSLEHTGADAHWRVLRVQLLTYLHGEVMPERMRRHEGTETALEVALSKMAGAGAALGALLALCTHGAQAMLLRYLYVRALDAARAAGKRLPTYREVDGGSTTSTMSCDIWPRDNNTARYVLSVSLSRVGRAVDGAANPGHVEVLGEPLRLSLFNQYPTKRECANFNDCVQLSDFLRHGADFSGLLNATIAVCSAHRLRILRNGLLAAPAFLDFAGLDPGGLWHTLDGRGLHIGPKCGRGRITVSVSIATGNFQLSSAGLEGMASDPSTIQAGNMFLSDINGPAFEKAAVEEAMIPIGSEMEDSSRGSSNGMAVEGTGTGTGTSSLGSVLGSSGLASLLALLRAMLITERAGEAQTTLGIPVETLSPHAARLMEAIRGRAAASGSVGRALRLRTWRERDASGRVVLIAQLWLVVALEWTPEGCTPHEYACYTWDEGEDEFGLRPPNLSHLTVETLTRPAVEMSGAMVWACAARSALVHGKEQHLRAVLSTFGNVAGSVGGQWFALTVPGQEVIEVAVMRGHGESTGIVVPVSGAVAYKQADQKKAASKGASKGRRSRSNSAATDAATTTTTTTTTPLQMQIPRGDVATIGGVSFTVSESYVLAAAAGRPDARGVSQSALWWAVHCLVTHFAFATEFPAGLAPSQTPPMHEVAGTAGGLVVRVVHDGPATASSTLGLLVDLVNPLRGDGHGGEGGGGSSFARLSLVPRHLHAMPTPSVLLANADASQCLVVADVYRMDSRIQCWFEPLVRELAQACSISNVLSFSVETVTLLAFVHGMGCALYAPAGAVRSAGAFSSTHASFGVHVGGEIMSVSVSVRAAAGGAGAVKGGAGNNKTVVPTVSVVVRGEGAASIAGKTAEWEEATLKQPSFFQDVLLPFLAEKL